MLGGAAAGDGHTVPVEVVDVAPEVGDDVHSVAIAVPRGRAREPNPSRSVPQMVLVATHTSEHGGYLLSQHNPRAGEVNTVRAIEEHSSFNYPTITIANYQTQL